MEDTKIIELYVNRDEKAITESQNKYGRFLTFLSKNILTAKEDAEECVNDTYLTAWNRIPPIIPESDATVTTSGTPARAKILLYAS